MAEPTAIRIEPRWPVVLAIIAVLALFADLPERVRVLPAWAPYLLGLSLLVPTAAVGLTAGSARWLRVERRAVFVFFLASSVSITASLAQITRAMVSGATELTGLRMLASSISMWVSLVLAFSLLYWQLDRGGPEGRMPQTDVKPDWLFPQAGDPALGGDHRPTFVDYLFLGFSTATAFSTTDTVPVTSRAKLLMMLESSLSLVTILIVAARAINILGG